jgi:hypothetical protein
MGRARERHQPRHAEASVLHGVIRDYLDEFLRPAADRADGAGLPEFGCYVVYALCAEPWMASMVGSPPGQSTTCRVTSSSGQVERDYAGDAAETKGNARTE